jgi:hypothetical protein
MLLILFMKEKRTMNVVTVSSKRKIHSLDSIENNFIAISKEF